MAHALSRAVFPTRYTLDHVVVGQCRRLHVESGICLVCYMHTYPGIRIHIYRGLSGPNWKFLESRQFSSSFVCPRKYVGSDFAIKLDAQNFETKFRRAFELHMKKKIFVVNLIEVFHQLIISLLESSTAAIFIFLTRFESNFWTTQDGACNSFNISGFSVHWNQQLTFVFSWYNIYRGNQQVRRQ